MAESLNLPKTDAAAALYEALIPQIKSLVANEPDIVANLANISSVLTMTFHHLWTGFYLLKGEELVLGPFQGPLACTRIKPGKGVCGQAFSQMETLIVPDVEEFPGHIACSTESRSEIVVPIIKDGKAIGVLDVDSVALKTFGEIDKKYLEQIAVIVAGLF